MVSQASANGSGRRPQQVTGNVGLYYACFMLSLHGWNAMPTARNARGVDIIAYDDEAKAFLGIQVEDQDAPRPGSSRHHA